ncbi:unnamed protein product [Prorocentrum cordatum]|uniref:Uncharacterized protein n=1 Tax=Prorocentrum cordatum TaxID=2364126 RepID=A0ABN9ULA5_9DINO|nr:unnamed protein product [Polarella glacialis]
MLGIKLQEIANHTCLHFQGTAGSRRDDVGVCLSTPWRIARPRTITAHLIDNSGPVARWWATRRRSTLNARHGGHRRSGAARSLPCGAAARPPRGAEPKLRGSATGWMMDWKMTAAVAGRPLSGAGTARGPARTRTALSRHSGWEKDMLSVEVLFQKLNLPVQNHNSSFICTAGSPSPPTPASLPPRSGTISPMASTLRKDDVEGG